MTQIERAEFIDKFYTNHCCKLLETKGVEYSQHQEDVNSNFKRLSQEIDISSKKVLFIYMKKHWDSIVSYIKTDKVLSEPIEGRIADLINYGFILASLIEEERLEKIKHEQEHGARRI